MDPFLKMDIFFLVTTVAVVVLGILMAWVLMRVLGILKKIDALTALAIEEGQQLVEDIGQVREGVRREGIKIGHLLGFFAPARKPRRTKKED